MASLFERDIVDQEQFVTLAKTEPGREDLMQQSWELKSEKSRAGGICFGGAMGKSGD